MPKFRTVMTSLAISTALAGGTLTLAATTTAAAASATTTASASHGWGWGHGCRGRNCNKLRNQNANLNYWRPTYVDRHRFYKTKRSACVIAGPDAVVDIDGDDDFD